MSVDEVVVQRTCLRGDVEYIEPNMACADVERNGSGSRRKAPQVRNPQLDDYVSYPSAIDPIKMFFGIAELPRYGSNGARWDIRFRDIQICQQVNRHP